MADQPNNQNRIVMILAATVVVLFIAFVAVVVLNSGNKTASTTATTDTTGASATAPATTGTSTANTGMSSSATFDPKTATKVPAGTTPADFVSKYYQSILDKKWDVAFKMQPAASQQGADVAGFQQTQTMYGMTKFSVFDTQVGSTEATVVISQDLGTNGTWNATWQFVKSGGSWLVKARKVGMGAPTK
jgi:hypothetical protein